MLGDTCLNLERYSNNDECEVVARLALQHETVLQEQFTVLQFYICI